MNPGDIFLNKAEDGEYDRYPDGSIRVYLCKAPHERVQDAYYIEFVKRTLGGMILHRDGNPSISRDAIMAKWPEVIE